MKETKITLNWGLEISKNRWFMQYEKSAKGLQNKHSETRSSKRAFKMVHQRKKALSLVISIINLLSLAKSD
jgi:hypothetical protein